MRTQARFINALAAVAVLTLGGCNLTYDREALEYTPGCASPLSGCPGVSVCVDLRSDPAHCGSCGNACISGSCNGSACDSCEVVGVSTCNTGGGDYCTDLTKDAANCGFCGNGCGAGTAGTCTSGNCDLACSPPAPNLCGAGATQYCTDFQSDLLNCGACNTVCTTCVAGVCDGGATALVVAPLFPNFGASWNDWVAGTDYPDATDTPCVVGSDCVHAGELRQVVVSGRSSCAGLTASDALGAFAWVCDGTTDPVRMISTGLLPGKRLVDLLDPSTPSMLSNQVTVFDGGLPLRVSSPTAWWSNPVAFVGAGGVMNAAGTIYVPQSGGVLPPFQILADRVAFATPVVLGTTAGTDLLSATTRSFLWVEGGYDATGARHAIRMEGVHYSVFREISIARPYSTGANFGLWLKDSSRNRVEHFSSEGSAVGLFLDGAAASDSKLSSLTLGGCDFACFYSSAASRTSLRLASARWGGTGFLIEGGGDGSFEALDAAGFYDGVTLSATTRNLLVDVATAANRQNGVRVTNAWANRFEGVSSTHSAGDGIRIELLSYGNAFADVLVSNNQGNGLVVQGANDNVFAGVTAALNDTVGATFFGSSGNVLMNAALTGNRWRGMQLVDAVSNTFVDLAIAGSTEGLVEEGASTLNRIHGQLLIGANSPSDCIQSTTLLPGAFDASCSPTLQSTFLLAPIGPLASSFFGSVQVAGASDTVNGYIVNYGTSPANVIDLEAAWFDWTHFENPYRAWARSSGLPGAIGCPSWPDARTEVSCSTTTWQGSAEAWDWSLRSADGVLRGIFPFPDAGATVAHTWSDFTSTTFLLHARERFMAPGDLDGLCEVGVDGHCLGLPSVGAYQGHGALSPAVPPLAGSVLIYGFEILGR